MRVHTINAAAAAEHPAERDYTGYVYAQRTITALTENALFPDQIPHALELLPADPISFFRENLHAGESLIRWHILLIAMVVTIEKAAVGAQAAAYAKSKEQLHRPLFSSKHRFDSGILISEILLSPHGCPL